MKILFFLMLISLFNAQDFQKFVEETKESHYNSALTFKELDSIVDSCPDISQYPELLFYKSSFYFKSENYPMMLQTLLEAKKYATDFELRFDILKNIGAAHMFSEDYDLAKAQYEEARQLAIDAKRPDEEYYAYESLLIIEIKKGNEKALKDYEDFFIAKDYSDNVCLEIETLSTIVDLYIDSKNFKKAKRFLEANDIDTSQVNYCDRQLIIYYIIKSRIAVQDEDYVKSLYYLNSIPLFTGNASRTFKSNVYKLYDKTYTGLGDQEKAKQYNDSIVSIQQGNIEVFNKSRVETVVEPEEEQNETTKKWGYFNYIIIFGVGALLVLGLRIFKSRKRQQQVEIDRSTYQDNYNSLWANYQLSNNQLLKMKEELIEQSKLRSSAIIDALIRRVSLHLKTTSDSEHKHFNLSKESFITKLEQKAPYLNDAERLICYFINLKFSHKRIAELINRSEKSIDSYRYRINKKIHFHQKIDLLTLIKSLK